MTWLRNFFWALALAVIAAYLFFLVLGAFAVDEVWPVTLVVVVLAVLWLVHSWLQRRHADATRDPLLKRARERRGF